MSDSLDPMAALLVEQACRDLVLRAAACADAGDAAGLAALYGIDAELTRPGGAVLRGRAAIEAAYRAREPGRLTAHLVFGSVFDEVGAQHAAATSRVLLWTSDTGAPIGRHGRAAHALQIVGSFRDRFALAPEGWRIAARVATFDLFRELAMPTQG